MNEVSFDYCWFAESPLVAFTFLSQNFGNVEEPTNNILSSLCDIRTLTAFVEFVVELFALGNSGRGGATTSETFAT